VPGSAGLCTWRNEFLPYFATGRARNNTEAINGIIELGR
jgi:hypothetical protein